MQGPVILLGDTLVVGNVESGHGLDRRVLRIYQTALRRENTCTCTLTQSHSHLPTVAVRPPADLSITKPCVSCALHTARKVHISCMQMPVAADGRCRSSLVVPRDRGQATARLGRSPTKNLATAQAYLSSVCSGAFCQPRRTSCLDLRMEPRNSCSCASSRAQRMVWTRGKDASAYVPSRQETEASAVSTAPPKAYGSTRSSVPARSPGQSHLGRARPAPTHARVASILSRVAAEQEAWSPPSRSTRPHQHSHPSFGR